jgi:hypothetical protein
MRRRKTWWASAFAPNRISGCVFWIRADQGLYQDTGKVTPAVSDTDPVALWEDLSGNGYDVSQATAAKRPILKKSVINGQDAVRFDAVDDFLDRASTPATTQPYTVVAFIDSNGVSTYSYMVDADVSADRSTLFKNDPRATTFGMVAGAPTLNATVADTTAPSILIGVFNTSSSNLRVNGSDTTGTVGSNVFNGITVGARQTGDNIMQGDIMELIVYDKELVAADFANLETYANNRYGI